MNATLTIDLSSTSPDVIADVLKMLNGSSASVTEPVQAPSKGKKITPPPATNKTETEAQKDVTVEQVRAAVAAKRDTHREQIKSLLTEFGAESVTKLDKANYNSFLQKVNAL
jgi:hypothetical protein